MTNEYQEYAIVLIMTIVLFTVFLISVKLIDFVIFIYCKLTYCKKHPQIKVYDKLKD